MVNTELRVFALASGSSGNAMLVQAGKTSLLIDAGLPLRTLSAHLAKRGVGANDLDAVLLTHEHHDHIVGAGAIARRTGAPLVANAATLAAYRERDALPFAAQEMPTGTMREFGPFVVRSFPVSHDAAECVGYVIEAGGSRIAYFTDTGCVTDAMRDALRGAHLAVVEANHDLQWLLRGTYSDDMKTRVASATGHLSNADCAAMLAERLAADGPMCIWLAHLSRANNSPSLAKRTVAAHIAAQTDVPFVLEVALRDSPSVFWRPAVKSVQLALL